MRLAALFVINGRSQDGDIASNASSLDESKLLDRDGHSDNRVALLHRVGRGETDLVNLPPPPRDQQVSHEQEAWSPDRDHPKHYGFYRVHDRPRHER